MITKSCVTDRCTLSQDLRLGQLNVALPPDTQGMTRMMMRKTRMMMMLMEALPMARETHVQTVVVSTGTRVCFVMAGQLPCSLVFCHCCSDPFYSMNMSISQLAACRTGDFWIQCDFCDTWYDGKCVQVRHFCLKSMLLHVVCSMQYMEVCYSADDTWQSSKNGEVEVSSLRKTHGLELAMYYMRRLCYSLHYQYVLDQNTACRGQDK